MRTPVVASKTGEFWNFDRRVPKWAFKPGDEQDLASALSDDLLEIEILNGVKDAESMFCKFIRQNGWRNWKVLLRVVKSCFIFKGREVGACRALTEDQPTQSSFTGESITRSWAGAIF